MAYTKKTRLNIEVGAKLIEFFGHDIKLRDEFRTHDGERTLDELGALIIKCVEEETKKLYPGKKG